MRFDIGHYCAHVMLAACLAQAGCAVMDHDGASERPGAASVQRALLTPGALGLGEWHTCARTGGAVQCWGHNGAGQLGYGNTDFIGDNESASTPGSVSVGGTVTEIDVGTLFTCALLDTGSVRCWGVNGVGQLGYGNTTRIGDDELPSSVGTVSLSSAVVHIATGLHHSCALLDTGLIQCWGEGGGGQLGYGATNDVGDNELPSSQSPVSAGGTVVQLAAGQAHTCALLDTGDVRCWGSSVYGQLGYGNNTPIGDNEAITSVGTVSVGGTVIQIAAGALHTCALLDTGDVRCWGYNGQGQLGYGNTTIIGNDELPSSAGDVDVGGTVDQIAAHGDHTCALLDTGDVRCWGKDQLHQLGYVGTATNIGDNELPSSAGNVDVGGAVIEVATGYHHTCAKLQTGATRCWGNGAYGKLGYGNTSTIGDNETPASAGNVP